MIDLKVMLVEDDEQLRQRLERILKREVSTVKSYGLPSLALQEFHDFLPDLIITDIKMPEMTGLDMLKIIRESFADIPVIIASAFSEPELFTTAIKLKVENYVVKPVDIEELLSTIRKVAENLNNRKLLQEKDLLLQQYKHIVDLSANIVITDKRGVITYVNDRFCILSGYAKEELIGKTHKVMRHPDMPSAFYKELWAQISDKKVWQGIIKNRHKNGTPFYGDTTIAPILNTEGQIQEYIAIKIDITDLISSQKKLQQDIITDRLTNLPNRIKLQDDFRSLDNYTMMLIDIDRFKEINLLFGIHLGDSVLSYFAKSLQYILQNSEIFSYRIASDEFILLSAGNALERFTEIAHALKAYIEQAPLEYDQVSFDIDFSCALIHTDDLTLNPIEQLQGTVSEAKRRKKFLLEHDTEAMLQKQYQENFEWTKKIRDGLNDERVIVYFQPIYSVRERKITKFESLVRLIDTDGTVIAPDKFLNAAKRSRHYRELTHTVISKACATFADTPYNFTINFSIEDLTDDLTLQFLIDTVQKMQLQQRLTVEVLESEGIDNFYTISKIFSRLTEAGVKIAIDDFGSGYSNYAYLVNLPVSTLKIDGSLIKNIVTDKSARVIVQSIVMFAHELGIKIIAEFVSDEEIFKLIEALDIDFAQGYFVGKPEARISADFTYDPKAPQ